MEDIREISCGGYRAKINVGRGANCISIRNTEYSASILREPDYSSQLDNPYLYGMPVLFPVNRISGGSFEFEGREYKFPVNEERTGCHLHGMLHATPFCVTNQTESKITCRYEATDTEPYLAFQHAFWVEMEYELTENGLLHRTTVKNLSDTNMPLMLGFHSTFNGCFTPDSKKENIGVKADIAKEYVRNMNNYLPTGEIASFDDVSNKLNLGTFNPFSQPISRHYRSEPRGRMVIYDKGTNLSVVYENDEKYTFRLIYNGEADEYICMEPQTCLANCPNSPFSREEAGFDYIEPGKMKTYKSKIYIKKGDMR